jgi:hypothetical protein
MICITLYMASFEDFWASFSKNIDKKKSSPTERGVLKSIVNEVFKEFEEDTRAYNNILGDARKQLVKNWAKMRKKNKKSMRKAVPKQWIANFLGEILKIPLLKYLECISDKDGNCIANNLPKIPPNGVQLKL